MHISPAYIQKSIIKRLKIKSCSQCDLLCDSRQRWNPSKKKKNQEKNYLIDTNIIVINVVA